jgi:hypothetical protein
MAAVGDIDAAYRQCPMAPKDKRLVVQRGNDGQFYVNQAVPFGVRPGAGICGAVLEPVRDILLASGVGPIRRWVDDIVFINCPLSDPPDPLPPTANLALSTHVRYFQLPQVSVTFDTPHEIARTAHPIEISETEASNLQSCGEGASVRAWRYRYTLDDVTAITDDLGVSWARQKWLGFAFERPFIGFLWDFFLKRVTLPDIKRLKYLARAEGLLLADGHKSKLQPVLKLHGCLMHITFVYRQGRSRLPSIQRFMNGFQSAHVTHTMTKTVLEDVHWWVDQLSRPGVYRNLVNRDPAVDYGISVDASSDWGIGLRVKNQYKAWRWKPGALGSSGRDIGGAESIAIEFSIRWLAARGIRSQTVKIAADNQGANGAFNRGRGRNCWTNEAIQRGWGVLEAAGLEIVVEYIASAANPADPVSRGIFGGLERLSEQFEIPADLVPFLYEV